MTFVKIYNHNNNEVVWRMVPVSCARIAQTAVVSLERLRLSLPPSLELLPPPLLPPPSPSSSLPPPPHPKIRSMLYHAPVKITERRTLRLAASSRRVTRLSSRCFREPFSVLRPWATRRSSLIDSSSLSNTMKSMLWKGILLWWGCYERGYFCNP